MLRLQRSLSQSCHVLVIQQSRTFRPKRAGRSPIFIATTSRAFHKSNYSSSNDIHRESRYDPEFGGVRRRSDKIDSNQQDLDEIRRADPVKLLKDWATSHDEDSGGKWQAEAVVEMCDRLGHSPQLLERSEGNEVAALMEQFLVWVAFQHGYRGLSVWGARTLRAGHPFKVVLIWNHLTSKRIQQEGRPDIPKRESQIPQKNYKKFLRNTLTQDDYASLFFSIVIWSYSTRPMSFMRVLTRLLRHTWVRPLSPILLTPFENSQSIRFGKDKIQQLLSSCIPDLDAQERARRFVCQVEMAQIGWPDFETVIPKVVDTLNVLMERAAPQSQWYGLLQTYLHGCDNQSGVSWLHDELPLWREDSQQLPLKTTIRGPRPTGGLYLPLLGTAIRTLKGNSTGLPEDDLIPQIIDLAIRGGSRPSYVFWYEALEGSVESGDLEIFQRTLIQMKDAGVETDHLCEAYRATALLKTGRIREAFSILKEIMSAKPLVFGCRSRMDTWWRARNHQFQRWIINALLEQHWLDEAIQFIKDVERHPQLQPIPHIYNMALSYLAKAHPPNYETRAEEILTQMVKARVPPNLVTFGAAAKIINLEEKLDDLLEMMTGLQLRPDPQFWVTVLTGLTKDGTHEGAKRALSIVKTRPREEINGCCKHLVIRGYIRVADNAKDSETSQTYLDTASNLFHIYCSQLDADDYCKIIYSLIRAHQYDFAMDVFEKFWNQDPGFFKTAIQQRSYYKYNSAPLFALMKTGFSGGGRYDLTDRLLRMRETLS